MLDPMKGGLRRRFVLLDDATATAASRLHSAPATGLIVPGMLCHRAACRRRIRHRLGPDRVKSLLLLDNLSTYHPRLKDAGSVVRLTKVRRSFGSCVAPIVDDALWRAGEWGGPMNTPAKHIN